MNYLILNDAILGACLLSERTITVKYMLEISEKCKYAEDMIYRLMISRNELIEYFPRKVIWYEFGEGISSSKNDKWKRIIEDERKHCNEMILKNNCLGYFDKLRFRLFTRKTMHFTKYLLFPEVIPLSLRKNSHKRFTDESDSELLRRITEE